MDGGYLLGGMRRGFRALRWYTDGVLGADAYRNYLRHMARTHPDQKPLDERAFWRDLYAWQERNPGARCC